MNQYAVATGYDHVLADLTPFPHQPKCDGIQAAQINIGLDESISRNALFAELEYSGGEYNWLLTALTMCGLSYTVRRSEVTVYLRREDNQWFRYNAIACYIEPKRSVRRKFKLFENAVIKFVKLREIS